MRTNRTATLILAGVLASAMPMTDRAAARANDGASDREGATTVQRGQASFYHPHRFTGRPMANGERFDPNSNSAAHRTLPFGTIALVTNLRTGESREVVIEDRGPHVRGRIIDLSPRVAEELGMLQAGVAPVEIRAIGRRGRDEATD
jgi:rare lipoprotein A